MSKSRFSITTAIDYPNGAPHMGHAYEKIVTDAYARWYRSLGRDVFFLTGTDENGQNLVKSAETAGAASTMAFVDQHVDTFKTLIKTLNISNDDFIRTTEERHITATQKLWKILEAKGDIYFGTYEGLYCTNCEAYYTEVQAPDGKCPQHYRVLDKVSEEGFFLKTSKYQAWIIEHMEKNPTFVSPDFIGKELLSRLKGEPMHDLSITRKNKGWGVKVPGNDAYVIYTWFDALINYYTASEPRGFWPNDMHVVGRDISWFHAVIWPIMLHAAELPLHKQVYVHGMILAADGKKMSKSLGNGVDPFEVVSKVPLDSFRYYLLRAIPANGNGAFVMEDLLKRHQSELGNDFGNLLMRVVKLARKRAGDSQKVHKNHFPESKMEEFKKDVSDFMDRREHHRALERIWQEINALNQFINDTAPWGLKDEDPAAREKFIEVIYKGLQGIDLVAQMMAAFMPETAAKALASLGQKPGVITTTPRDYTLSDPPVLFPRMEPAKA